MIKRETLELVRAYYKIRKSRVRKRIFEMVKAVGPPATRRCWQVTKSGAELPEGDFWPANSRCGSINLSSLLSAPPATCRLAMQDQRPRSGKRE
jgi:hypothetical protein